MIRISVSLPVAALAALLLPVALHGQENRPVGSVDPQRIVPNDNRRPAGRLEDGVLTLSLTAREGMWHPHGFERPGIPVGAFAENEGRLQMPGPLIRVPVGTEVRTTVRNALGKPLAVFGLGAERGVSGDSVLVEPDTSAEFAFVADEPGGSGLRGTRKTGRPKPAGFVS